MMMTRPLKELLGLPDEALVDDREAALVLGLAPLTMRNWRSKGRGPSHRKLGGAVRYLMGDLRRFRDAPVSGDRTPPAAATA
jgi:hypothetical protein